MFIAVMVITISICGFVLVGQYLRGELEQEGPHVRPAERSRATRVGYPILIVLLLMGSLFGMRGLSADGARFEPGTEPTVTTSIRLEPHETPTPDYLTTPEPGVQLAPGETVQAIPLEVWRASLVMSDEHRYELLRACWCESRWQTDVVGLAGEQGACQVLARFHGPVPSDLRGQFEQADRIATQHGMTPWTTKAGCPQWNR